MQSGPVVHLFGRMARGGAESRTVAMLPHIPDTFPQHFVSLSGEAGDLDASIRQAGGAVHRLRLGRGFAIGFRRLVRDLGARVVHSHIHHASGPALALAWACGVPGRVAHYRSTGTTQAASFVRSARDVGFRALVDACSTQILAVSAGAMRAARGASWAEDARCHVLYAGVDLESYATQWDRAEVRASLDLPPDGPVVAHVGNMTPAKNHAKIARVFAAFAARRPDARLLLIGRIEASVQRQMLRDTLEPAGLSDRVCFAGVRHDVPRALCAGDVFLFPSVYEGLPGAVVEARARGLPVVATNLPGIEEIAERIAEVTCLPVDAADTAWAAAVSQALDRPSKAASLAGSVFDSRESAKAHVDAWVRSLS